MGPKRADAAVSAPAGLTARARLGSRTDDAFAEEERQGLMLATKVRMIALGIVLLWQAVDSLESGFAYYLGLAEIASFVVLGLLQYICARQRFHMDQLKYLFVVADCALLAFIFTYESPFETVTLPPALQVEGSRFTYFFMLLMQTTFSFRPRLVLWCGLWIVVARAGMWLWFINRPGAYTNIDLPEQSVEAYLAAYPDPNFIFLGYWATEIIVTVILAGGLALVVGRSRRLVESRSIAERTRASLARYFSPNVVDHISGSGENLGGVREQEVAVLFADIMGFTKLCEREPADKVIALLRDYHNRLGQAVFDNGGTLDKYIGDGLMATFGTPESGPDDARNALRCALDMIRALESWNRERSVRGAAPLRVGIGLHYGPVIAGDIGNERRLEYSVIGDTVNIASRLEQLTRSLDTPLVVSDSLVQAIARDEEDGEALLSRLSRGGMQSVRGRESGVAVWTYEAA